MSGASVRIETSLEDKELQDAFRRMQKAVANPTGILKAIGTGLVEGTHQRFEQAVDPEGKPWKPLNTVYASSKRGAGILRESGMRGGLMGSVTMQADSDSVEVGTNKIYAAVHQFGATITAKKAKRLFFFMGDQAFRPQSVTIEARPFIGISKEDEEMTLDVVEGALLRASGKT